MNSKILRTYGSWTLGLFLALGVAGCPKDEKKADDKKTESADKKTEDKKPADKPADKKDDKKKDDKKKPTVAAKKKEKKDEKKLDDADQGKKPPADKPPAAISDKLPETVKKNPAPKDWDVFYDDVRQYAFAAPKGSMYTTDELESTISSDGKLSYWDIVPPSPYEFTIDFVSFKDATLTQDDLIDDAQAWLVDDDKATDVKFDEPIQINGRSKLVHYDETLEGGKHQKGMVLVFTDVTDNYMLFVDIDADKYDANDEIMDGVWQSFTIYGRTYE